MIGRALRGAQALRRSAVTEHGVLRGHARQAGSLGLHAVVVLDAAATELVDESVRNDPGVYPPPEVLANLAPDLTDTEETTRLTISQFRWPNRSSTSVGPVARAR